jgi:hypothetical protein
VIGIIADFGLLNQQKKSERTRLMPVTVGAIALFFGCSGCAIGSRFGKTVYIEKRLGIDKPIEDGYFQSGKYWKGVTKWSDKRDNKVYVLLTGRSNIKNLVTAINDRPIIIHDCQSASRITVPRYHTQARNKIWKILKDSFQETPQNLENIILTVAG